MSEVPRRLLHSGSNTSLPPFSPNPGAPSWLSHLKIKKKKETNKKHPTNLKDRKKADKKGKRERERKVL